MQLSRGLRGVHHNPPLAMGNHHNEFARGAKTCIVRCDREAAENARLRVEKNLPI